MKAGSRPAHTVRRAALVAAGILAAALFAIGIGLFADLPTFGLDYRYLLNRAGIDLSEGSTIALEEGLPGFARFGPEMANWQALLAGLFNNLKIIVVALVASTLLGTLVGVALLSRNALVRALSFGYVELIRNTPLLVQLVFWYFAIILSFPPVSAAIDLYGWLIVSRRGISFPGLSVVESGWLSIILAACVLVLVCWYLWRRPGPGRLPIALLSFGALIAAIPIVGSPVELSFPVVKRFSVAGGIGLSAELTGMLLALVVFTAAYIAEIIRGVILSVPRGQSEAAQALGLSNRHTMQDVILPQVYRVVLPALSNQYVSLAKNTSLGIAIGYPDLFNVSGTIANQTGRNFESILLVMLAYLLVSWTIIGGTSAINAALRRRA